VPDEDATAAIRDFASQPTCKFFVAGDNVKEKHLHALSGEFSTDQGLRILLADSGLTPQYINHRSIALVTTSSATTPGAKQTEKSSRNTYRVAQAEFSNSFGPDWRRDANSQSNSQELSGWRRLS